MKRPSTRDSSNWRSAIEREFFDIKKRLGSYTPKHSPMPSRRAPEIPVITTPLRTPKPLYKRKEEEAKRLAEEEEALRKEQNATLRKVKKNPSQADISAHIAKYERTKLEISTSADHSVVDGGATPKYFRATAGIASMAEEKAAKRRIAKKQNAHSRMKEYGEVVRTVYRPLSGVAGAGGEKDKAKTGRLRKDRGPIMMPGKFKEPETPPVSPSVVNRDLVNKIPRYTRDLELGGRDGIARLEAVWKGIGPRYEALQHAKGVATMMMNSVDIWLEKVESI
ncbi:hypothetical protein J8273_2675 [Carpediemonas membranifera]|uniref:Uncharacterized protein n=1 Tax=Carpediemonas membranifera TaxID=201153 RepID=A0A8J6B4X9_9EUKA|nr:hypothetical protein J8273_2675 [Carpediemonas membranifera]|eukprot:KAG9395763.1 hypothetical protein J8273_2675 [Carpediemonas membranifera]